MCETESCVKSKLTVFLMMLIVIAVAGCSTKSQVYMPDRTIHIAKSSKFAVGETVDISGFVFEEQSEKFSLSDAMAGSINAALAMDGLSGSTTQYTIRTKITGYAPGNAFARWLIPGAGATELKIESIIVGSDGQEVARIPVERSIAAGGGYTIKAYKYVFDDVAKELVRVIKERLLMIKPA